MTPSRASRPRAIVGARPLAAPPDAIQSHRDGADGVTICLRLPPIPSGLRPKAQGCGVLAATLGIRIAGSSTPKRVVSARHVIPRDIQSTHDHPPDTSPLGLEMFFRTRPKVGLRASAQPWSVRHNPLGIVSSPHSLRLRPSLLPAELPKDALGDGAQDHRGFLCLGEVLRQLLHVLVGAIAGDG